MSRVWAIIVGVIRYHWASTIVKTARMFGLEILVIVRHMV